MFKSDKASPGVVALGIVQESLGIGAFAAAFWPFKALSAAYALGRRPSWSHLIKREGGYWSFNRASQSRSVFKQMAGNCSFHRCAEQYLSHNIFIVSCFAALGACVGTFKLTQKEAGNTRSILQILRSTRMALPRSRAALLGGYLCEVTREGVYNVGCLNALARLHSYPLSDWQKIIGTGVLSTLAGIISGIPNAFASRFYNVVFDAQAVILPTAPQWGLMARSSLYRGVGIGCVFTAMATCSQISSSLNNPENELGANC